MNLSDPLEVDCRHSKNPIQYCLRGGFRFFRTFKIKLKRRTPTARLSGRDGVYTVVDPSGDYNLRLWKFVKPYNRNLLSTGPAGSAWSRISIVIVTVIIIIALVIVVIIIVVKIILTIRKNDAKFRRVSTVSIITRDVADRQGWWSAKAPVPGVFGNCFRTLLGTGPLRGNRHAPSRNFIVFFFVFYCTSRQRRPMRKNPVQTN